MSRSSLSWFLVLALLVACGDSSDYEDPSDLLSDGAVEANIEPLPDFHSYVVGEIPHPPRSRDPFDTREYIAGQQIETRPTPQAELRLRGIVESQGRLVALLGGQHVGRGEFILGWKVIHVDEKTVVLTKGMKTKRLSL